MHDTAKVRWSLLGTVGVLAFAGVAWWLATPTDSSTGTAGRDGPAPADHVAAQVTAVALAQIEAENAGDAIDGNAGQRVEAPPGFVAKASMPKKVDGGADLPDGFEVTAFHGAMPTARMTALDFAPPRDPVADQPWLAAETGTDRLIAQAAAAGRDWTFGWVALDGDGEPAALERRLNEAGAEVLGTSGHLLRARLPADRARLDEIAGLAGVAGVAATPIEIKLPAPGGAAGFRSAQGMTPTIVTLMTDDPDGRWRQALADFGGVVGVFDSSIRAYPANFPPGSLALVAAADFVLAVEPVGVVEPAHSSAVPAMGADAVRIYDASSRMFSGIGGQSVPIGVMDSGLNIRHQDIGTGRRSICGANFATVDPLNDRVDDQDLWIDAGLHGTHVTGTIIGNGMGGAQHAGMAPLVQDVRFARVISGDGGGSVFGILRGMDFLAEPSACGPADAPALRPLIVNMSLGTELPEWDGRSVSERKLDATVWSNRQLYVVAQANSAFMGYGDFASAKNALAVGAAEDGGDVASFSSHGPTADGRLKPQVVATGVAVSSTRGDGRRTGYIQFSGTSMSSPATAGVAALLMDAVPAYREQPAAVRARLMASAIRPDAFLDDADGFRPHNGDGPGSLQNRYGLGKVSARTSVLTRDQPDGWVGGSAVVDVGDGEYGYRDIEVPQGASRLDVVMTWDERPADTFASTVLNDLDLWVDRDVDCAPSQPAACGDAASRSTKDNVEWLILRDPPPGTYRLKVVPKYARVDTPRAAVAWTVIRGPSTPQLAISPARTAVTAAAGELFEIEAMVSTDGYVAAGTKLRVDCRDEGGSGVCELIEPLALKASVAEREDAVVATLDGQSSDAVALGEVVAGEGQTVRLVFKPVSTPARFRIHLTAIAWNATSASTSVDVAIGDAGAAAPTVASAPTNDHYDDALLLAGDAGSVEFDLLLATPEPGEPAFRQNLLDDTGDFQRQRRPRSVWYRWTAATTGMIRFTIGQRADGIGDDIGLDVFERRESGLSDLEHIAARFGGGLTFAARRGQSYAIRLGVTPEQLFDYAPLAPVDPVASMLQLPVPPPEPIRRRPVRPLSLRWQPAALPANDDFELAIALGGASGVYEGSNLGATEQVGERLQPLAASTWYRWIAPANGDFSFEVNRRHLSVAAFTGDAVDELRLVSGTPDRNIVFPARAGDAYIIAVAANSAYTSGSDYALSWGSGLRLLPGDDIAAAEPLIDAPSFFHLSFVDLANATVEPGEPIETGVRTAWWTWTAPFAGRYAWRASTNDAALSLAVFEDGDALTLLGESSGARQAEQLVAFDAVAGGRYLISAGLPLGQALQPTAPGEITFEWGPTPANDDLAAAETLSGVYGQVLGSNAFATVTPGEPAGALGDASVWWTWEVTESLWYRLTLEDQSGGAVVAVYQILGDGGLTREPVAVSRRLPDPIVVFRADAGERYAIRVGAGGFESGGEFGLNWAPNGAPTWLRFAGAQIDGDIDPAGNVLDLGELNSIALNDDASELYVATQAGLQVFARDAASGKLTQLQMLYGVDERAQLFWDTQSSSVIAFACGSVSRFPAAGEEGGLGAGVPVAGTLPCFEDELGAARVVRDSSGTFLHFVDSFGFLTFEFDPDRSAITMAGAVPVAGLVAAAMGATDEFVYAIASDGLLVYAHDSATGALLRIPAEFGNPAERLPLLTLLAADPTGRHLFGITDERSVVAFDLTDPAAPVLLAQGASIGLPPIDFAAPPFLEDFFDVPYCGFAVTRRQTMTVDVVCEDVAFSRRLIPDARTVRQEELLWPGGVDAFDNNVPPLRFELGLAASADGRHIYAAAPRGIAIFERAGSR